MSEYIQPATANEVALRLSTLQGPIRLYRSGINWFCAEYRGLSAPFWFPPDLGEGKVAVHPNTKQEVPADGIFTPKPLVEMLYREQPGAGAVSVGMGVGPGLQPSEIATFMLIKYGERGVVLLDGQSDESARSASRQLVYASRRTWAEKERSTRLTEVEVWKKNNPGLAPPPPSRTQQQAQEWLDEQTLRQASKYQCPEGCMETNDPQVYERHMLAAHKRIVSSQPAPDPAAERERLLAEREALLAEREAALEALTAPTTPAVPRVSP